MYKRRLLFLLSVLCSFDLHECSAGETDGRTGYCEMSEETYNLTVQLKEDQIKRWQVTKLDEFFAASECFLGNESQEDQIDERETEETKETESTVKPRILNGNDTKRGRYDYMVSLTDNADQHLCGGSLIAPDIILTAAHCFGFVKKAQIGRYDISESSEDYEKIDIKGALIHPDYDSRLVKNDFMLILLQKPIVSYSHVSLKEDETIPESLVAMGWGVLSEEGLPYQGPLQEVALTYVPNRRCSQASGFIEGNPVSYDGLIQDSMICAGDLIGDTCYGDSGGPLIIKGSNDQTDVQVGIVSWGFGCNKPQFPGVFARIPNQISWIKETACVLSSYDPPSLGCQDRRLTSDQCINDSDCRRRDACIDGICVSQRESDKPSRENDERSREYDKSSRDNGKPSRDSGKPSEESDNHSRK